MAIFPYILDAQQIGPPASLHIYPDVEYAPLVTTVPPMSVPVYALNFPLQ